MTVTQKKEGVLIAHLQKGFVTIPELQIELKLTYKEARSLIEYATKRKWIAECESGNQFPTVTSSFARKDLPADVCDLVYDELDGDDLKVLYFLGRRFSATFADILKHVDDDEGDMWAALDVLLRVGLIFRHGSHYYCKISRRAISAIKKRGKAKPSSARELDLFDW